MQNVQLTIEKSSDGSVWGRVEYDNDLLVDAAKSEEALERKFRRLLKVFHQVDPDKIKFKITYDLTSIFDKNEVLNVSAIAKRVGINSSLLRQYTSGIKTPSQETVNKIEKVIHGIAKELSAVRISTPRR